jgi:hypothetical protein
MSWAWVRRIIFCSRDEKGNPVVETKKSTLTRTQRREGDERYLGWLRGWPAHKVEARVAERLRRVQKKG